MKYIIYLFILIMFRVNIGYKSVYISIVYDDLYNIFKLFESIHLIYIVDLRVYYWGRILIEIWNDIYVNIHFFKLYQRIIRFFIRVEYLMSRRNIIISIRFNLIKTHMHNVYVAWFHKLIIIIIFLNISLIFYSYIFRN